MNTPLNGNGRPKQLPELKHPPTGKRMPDDWTEVERYPLNPPYSYAVIAESPSKSSKGYFVDEISLTPAEVQVYAYILETLQNELTVPRNIVDPRAYFTEQAKKVAIKYSLQLPRLSWAKILYYAERDIVGFGLLDGPMRDQNIEDISVDGVDRPVLVYHRRYERIPSNIVFKEEESLNDLLSRFAHIAGKHISVAFPIMQGILPGGHRVMATFRKEVSPRGSTLSIRKFKEDPITIIDMLNDGTLDQRAAAYLWFAMENRLTAIVVGSTGAGKTTMLNAILTLLRTNSKIVTIEEVQEINLAHQGWTALVSREGYGVTEDGPKGVGLFDLVKAAMRMRPDVLAVGEVRGEEAYVLFQAIATGHGGLCTLHADDSTSAIQRLVSKPMDVPESFIPFLDLAVTVRRITMPIPGGGTRSVRRIIAIDEVLGVNDYNRMFTWDASKDKFIDAPLKNSKKLSKMARDLGLTQREAEREIQHRGVVLAWMQKKSIRNFKEITELLQEYVNDPESMYSKATQELWPQAEAMPAPTPQPVQNPAEPPSSIEPSSPVPVPESAGEPQS